jgi:hypothetical protein
MLNQISTLPLVADVQVVGAAFQMATAVIAAIIGMITFRYTKRQSALALINENNSLANLVNATILQSEQARETLGRLHNFVVGCPDDAILFMYLNYVHNTFRMYQIGAITSQVWQDTLSSCACMMGRLRRDQLEGLLSRGYERAFQVAVLARYDANVAAGETQYQHDKRRPQLAVVR